MTMQDLLGKAYQTESNGMAIRVCDVQEFVYSHLCIPKGETLQAKVSGHWFDVCTAFPSVEYRIKERVVYEWQYCLTAPNCGCTYTTHMTDEEAEHYDMSYYNHMTKIENTKRIKK